MGGWRVVAPLVIAVALAGCAAPGGASDDPAGVPVVRDPSVVEQTEAGSDPIEDGSPAAGGDLAWAGYDAAYGVTSSQVLGTAVEGVSYVVRAMCVADAPVDLWFEVSVDEEPSAEAAFGCGGTEMITPLGVLPEGAVVTVELVGEVDLTTGASVMVSPAGG